MSGWFKCKTIAHELCAIGDSYSIRYIYYEDTW